MASVKKQVVIGVDVGSTKVITTIASGDNETGDINIIGYGEVASTGMRKGMVVDIDETISAISNSLEEAERMSGVPIEHVLLSISGQHVSSSNSRGVIAVSRPNGEIGKDDISRVIEAAKAFSMPANREVIHVIPRSFIVDGQEGVKDPLGMKGIRLEADAHVITASSPVVKNLLKCAYQAGADVDELVSSSLAASKALLNRKQKEIGVVLVDIGGGSTSLAVFEEGEVLHTAVLPVGSSHITNDIAIGLRTSIEIAEKVKVEFGAATPVGVSERDMIDLSHIDPSLAKNSIKRKYIIEIINARLEEIFIMIKDELRKVGRDGLLPAGAIITGGGSKTEGIVDVARQSLRLPAQLGVLTEPIMSIEKDILENPSFSTAIGLILWGMEERKEQILIKNIWEGAKSLGRMMDKAKDIFRKK